MNIRDVFVLGVHSDAARIAVVALCIASEIELDKQDLIERFLRRGEFYYYSDVDMQIVSVLPFPGLTP